MKLPGALEAREELSGAPSVRNLKTRSRSRGFTSGYLLYASLTRAKFKERSNECRIPAKNSRRILKDCLEAQVVDHPSGDCDRYGGLLDGAAIARSLRVVNADRGEAVNLAQFRRAYHYGRQPDATNQKHRPGGHQPQLARAAHRKIRSLQSRAATRLAVGSL